MKRAFLLVTSAVLAGCGTFQEPERVRGPAAAEQTPAAADIQAGLAPEDAVNRLQDRLDAVPLPRKKPTSIAAIPPDALVGLTPQEVVALIGRPVSRSDEPPAMVWSYRTNHCALEVFFYMDVGTRTFRALTFNLTNPGGNAASSSHCLRQIRAVAYGG